MKKEQNGKRPQAQNDAYLFSENDAGPWTLDVLANDRGGHAASLHSVFAGSWTGKKHAPQTSFISAITGALVSVGADGSAHYDLGVGSALNLDFLAEGETLTDTFSYALRLGNGSLSFATATVTIIGVNDPAQFGGTATGAISEDGAGSTSGQIVVADPDHDQGALQAAQLTGAYGALEVQADGRWTYMLDEALADPLGAGEVRTETFTIHSADGSESQIVVTVTGAHDSGGGDHRPPVWMGDGDPTDDTQDSFPQTGNEGTSGGDMLYGGPGDDVMNGLDGPDFILGRGGNDTIYGVGSLYGQRGDDTIIAGGWSDYLYGGSGSDRIDGGAGADSITGGYGADTLTGGSGRDRFIYGSNRDTGDVITDFVAGEDFLDFRGMGLQDGDVSWAASGDDIVVSVRTTGDAVDLEITLAGASSLSLSDIWIV